VKLLKICLMIALGLPLMGGNCGGTGDGDTVECSNITNKSKCGSVMKADGTLKCRWSESSWVRLAQCKSKCQSYTDKATCEANSGCLYKSGNNTNSSALCEPVQPCPVVGPYPAGIMVEDADSRICSEQKACEYIPFEEAGTILQCVDNDA
jgi:hypothetical protein